MSPDRQRPEPVAARPCVRCGTPQAESFRFCPQCGLPSGVEPILSTQIEEARRDAERGDDAAPRPTRERAALVAAASLMGFVVVGLGMLVFDPELLQRLTDAGAPPPTAPPRTRQDWEPEWVQIAPGECLSGPPWAIQRIAVRHAYAIAKYELTNDLWHQFLLAEAPRLRELGELGQVFPRTGPDGDGWEPTPEGIPRPQADELHRPVRGVSATGIAWFCDWATRRLGEPGWRIRPPTVLEWEFAARGGTARRYPWGDTYWVDGPAGTGIRKPFARYIGGLSRPSSVYAIDDDVTERTRIVGMGSNVEEIALPGAPDPGVDCVPYLTSLLRNVVRLGAGYVTDEHSGELCAQAWYRDRNIELRGRLPELGVRLVKVDARAVPDEE